MHSDIMVSRFCVGIPPSENNQLELPIGWDVEATLDVSECRVWLSRRNRVHLLACLNHGIRHCLERADTLKFKQSGPLKFSVYVKQTIQKTRVRKTAKKEIISTITTGTFREWKNGNLDIIIYRNPLWHIMMTFFHEMTHLAQRTRDSDWNVSYNRKSLEKGDPEELKKYKADKHEKEANKTAATLFATFCEENCSLLNFPNELDYHDDMFLFWNVHFRMKCKIVRTIKKISKSALDLYSAVCSNRWRRGRPTHSM